MLISSCEMGLILEPDLAISVCSSPIVKAKPGLVFLFGLLNLAGDIFILKQQQDLSEISY